MPLPTGTVPVGGPLLDTSGALLTASPALRAAGVISLRGGRFRRVNADGDGWEDVIPSTRRGAWSATARYSDGDIFTHHDTQFIVHGGQDNVLIPEPIQYQERRDDIQIVGTHWAALKTSINSDDTSTVTSYFSIGQRWIFADERAFICVETGMYLHSDIPSSDGWKEIGAGSARFKLATAIYAVGSARLTLTPAAGESIEDGDLVMFTWPANVAGATDMVARVGNGSSTDVLDVAGNALNGGLLAGGEIGLLAKRATDWQLLVPDVGHRNFDQITDAALDIDDPSTESTGTGASRQSVAEAIRAARGVISGEGGPPQAAAELEGFVFVDLDSLDLLVCSNTPHQTSEATGTFTEITSVTILPDYASRPTPTLDQFYYVPDQNQFLVGTQLGPGIVGYVQDSAGDALANDRETNITLIHWLGRLDTDEEAAGDIQTLVANTNYFYYSRQLQQIRRLTRSSFTPAGGTVDHYNWAPPKADDYKNRVLRVQGGALPSIPRDGTGDDWIRISDDGLYIVDIENHPATTPTADSWATFADGTDYEGVAANDGDIPIAGTQYYFNSRHFTFRNTYIDTSLAVRYRDRAVPSGYIGHFESRADALNHAAARGIETGDNFSAFTGTLVEEATDFTPAASFETTRDWVFIPVDADGGGGGGGVDSVPVMLFEGPDTPATYVPNVAARPTFRPLVLSRAPMANRTLQLELVVNTPANTTANPTPTGAVTIYTSDHIETNNLVGDDALPALAGAQLTTFSSSQNQGPSVGNTKGSKIGRGNENDANDFGHSNLWIGHGLNADGDFVLYVAHSHWSSVAAHIIRVKERSFGSGTDTSEAGAVGERSVARSIISSGHNLAITPRTFNPSTGTPGFAFSAFSFDNVPLSGLDSFSATIRVGGRAGFTIYLSKEQIEYAQNQNSTEWVFTDANNYTGGSVIPAVFLEGRHNSGQPFRSSVKPTRSQVGYISESTEGNTGVLIFFVYDPASENINHVWTVAFSDVDVEVETMHLHYFEDAE